MWDPTPFTSARASFTRPQAAPAAGPCDPPLACVQINAEYIALIAGAMSQLTQRVAWHATDEADLQRILANMVWAQEIIGTAVQCTEPIQIPGQPTSQRACSIAGYIANYIIRETISQGINATTNLIPVLDFGWAIIRAIPGFAEALPITWLALNGLLAAINTFGTGPFQTAIDDTTLFPAITCAIYNAILADGQVTNSNFPAIVANISALTFADANVKTTIIDFVNNMGPQGLQNVQTGGPLAVYDCSGCGSGPALGPIGPNPSLISGSDLLTIVAGAADVIVPILFGRAFTSPPLLTAGANDETVIASVENVNETGFDLRLSAIAPVLVDTAATVDWVAQLPAGP